jgi:hypothetical protein
MQRQHHDLLPAARVADQLGSLSGNGSNLLGQRATVETATVNSKPDKTWGARSASQHWQLRHRSVLWGPIFVD